MRVVSHRKLKDFFETPGNESTKVPLERWYEIAESADWRNFAEMKADFGSVDRVGNQQYVFNISGNNFRLVVIVKFVMEYEKEYFPIEKPTVSELIVSGLSEKKMTHKELAEAIGVSQSRVSDFVAGRSEPSLRQASLICQCLGIRPSAILGI